jgi:hypothetical protein
VTSYRLDEKANRLTLTRPEQCSGVESSRHLVPSRQPSGSRPGVARGDVRRDVVASSQGRVGPAVRRWPNSDHDAAVGFSRFPSDRTMKL